MTLVQKEVKAVYLWTTKVRPAYKPRTFTITRTEKSDMSSWWTYSDDAAWLTAGDGAFDDFFWYSAVLLNTSGVETAEMKQSWWVFTGAMTTLGNITSGDNVMIKFPVRWIKMTKSWSTVTLSITEELNKDGYQYYAFQTWTLSNPWTAKDQFYLWAYKWYNNSSTLKSWSGQTPTANTSYTNFCTYAKNNWTWYNIAGYYQRMYIQALYMMKYGNPDGRATVWYWVSSWSKLSTWGTNSQTNATYWASWGGTQIKLFWLEDRYWNLKEIIWWAYSIYSGGCKLYTQLSNWNWTLSWWEDTWTTLINKYWWNISWIAGTNKWMFAPTGAVSNSSYNTYYCWEVYVSQSTVWAVSWWAYNEWTNVRLFRTDFMYTTDYNVQIWARLMYL